MFETKILRFAVATMTIGTFIFFAQSEFATAMTIPNGSFAILKDRKLAFGSLDVSTIFDIQKGNSDVVVSTLGLADDPDAKEHARKAAILDNYFHERNMPLKGYGLKMIQEAEKNNIDWRLLPAIAIRESSGGKYACDQNPFGWASCKDDFESIDDAIETVAWNLGGNNPRTDQYYRGNTRRKLFHYNGSVIRKYPDQVLRIMEKIAG